MSTVTTVVFDLGNVLIDWDPRYLYRKLFSGDEAGMERFLAEIDFAAWNERQDAGRSFAEAVAVLTAEHPGHAKLIAAFAERWEETLGEAIAGTVAVLEQLRRTDLRLLALTNWSAETFPVARRRFPFLSWFESILVSGEEKLIKPDPRIFQLLIDRYRLQPQQTLFIDDMPRNVQAAENAGLVALRFHGPERLVADLRGLGIAV